MTGSTNNAWYTTGEAQTATGQLVRFSCPVPAVEEVKKFLQTSVRTIDIPATRCSRVAHGSYERYSRYEIKQHDYAAGGAWGYIEVLEIENPPDNRCGFVIFEYRSASGALFTEWQTIENARAAFAACWRNVTTKEEFPKHEGYLRRVECGDLTPWFYAIGDELLIEDYAFPEKLQNDPVYRFGRKFVVFDSAGIPEIKTCMGTRIITHAHGRHLHGDEFYRLVHWSDGTVWNENSYNPAQAKHRPLEDNELWIDEAVRQFKMLLAGAQQEFSITFTNGTKFVGKLDPSQQPAACEEGEYYLVVQIKGQKKAQEGWVTFTPTVEAPNVIQYITKEYQSRGQEVVQVRIEERKSKRLGKKWSGVFFPPPR